jgi:hypothetical protein
MSDLEVPRRSAMSRLTDVVAHRPRLAWVLTVVFAIVVAGCKNNGGGSGY